MARLELAPAVGEDFERIFAHLLEHEASAVEHRIRLLIEAIDVLRNNPFIGRPARGELRELVIGKRERGCVALYSYLGELDLILVLAVRSQREAGFHHD